MLNLFRAEWKKTIGNRWVTGCMMGVFPVGAAAGFAIAILVFAFWPGAKNELPYAILWTEPLLLVWFLSWSNLGRLLLAGFTAVLFAGEYQWGTWKSIIPRNRRFSLLMVKYVTLGAIVVSTFVLVSVIALIGYLLIALVGGIPVKPALSEHVLTDFIGDYATQVMLTFLSTLIIAGYTALIAMLTRSMVGGILVGVGAILVETLILPVALLIVGSILDMPSIIKMITFLPVYNFNNISSWVVDDHSATMDMGDIMVSRSLLFSIVAVGIWVFGLIGLTVYIFRRQDITS